VGDARQKELGGKRIDKPFGQGRRQEAEGTYVDVTVYTRMKCLLPCLAHNGSKKADLSGTEKNLLRDAQ